MNANRVLDQLADLGPGSPPTAAPSLRAAQAYCRHFTRTNYENFTVGSLLLPRRLRPHFYSLYAYCRWADDLADEAGDPQHSLQLLAWWQRQLDECYAGRASHPVFVALAATIAQHNLPRQPLDDLLDAFRQDQRQTRYETVAELLHYCRRSANPVGRLVLHLAGAADAAKVELSDRICTGLQLANFCQDVARDYEKGRIYLPRESWRRFGCDERTFAGRSAVPEFRQLLAHEVARAERFLQEGRVLAERLPGRLRVDVRLFAAGGLAILEQIRRARYDVWSCRPTVGKWQKLRLFVRAAWRP